MFNLLVLHALKLPLCPCVFDLGISLPCLLVEVVDLVVEFVFVVLEVHADGLHVRLLCSSLLHYFVNLVAFTHFQLLLFFSLGFDILIPNAKVVFILPLMKSIDVWLPHAPFL